MARKGKLGDTRGVRQWRNLDSIGDVKRFLRWSILSMRNGSLDRQDAAVFYQGANVLLRVIEGNDLERRLTALEARLQQHQPYTLTPSAALHQAGWKNGTYEPQNET
jgi:hypothetical protein